ncbi:MAG TPA: hypothetical protein VMG40_02945 [Bryobacteraceae bacterium]|nr:hypothetical protein [Bryobacteraceae bacterium]
MKKSLIPMLIAATMTLPLASPVFARIEGYGPRRFTQVGHYHGHPGGVVIDRRVGPGWGGALAAGLLGAAAGYAIGAATAPPPPVVVAPPAVGTVVPALPGYCTTVPTASGVVLYDCGNIYYQPIYEGTALMYQVVPGP